MIRQDREHKVVTVKHENGQVTYTVDSDGMVEMGYETDDGESDPMFWTFDLGEIEAIARICRQLYNRIHDEEINPRNLHP